MLLQRVSSVRSIKFYQIVPADHLMGRLAADASRPAMCSAMAKLLAPSYFPQNDDPATAARSVARVTPRGPAWRSTVASAAP